MSGLTPCCWRLRFGACFHCYASTPERQSRIVGLDVMKLRLEDIYGAPGFIVEGISFGNLCDYLRELEGVVFTFRRRFFLSSRDIRAEFTFGGNEVEIRPDPADSRIWFRPKGGSADFAELRKVRDFINGLALRESRRVGKSKRTSCIVSASAALIILLGGWLYPIFYLSHDLDLRREPDPDFRASVVFPFAILLSLIFAGRACRFEHVTCAHQEECSREYARAQRVFAGDAGFRLAVFPCSTARRA